MSGGRPSSEVGQRMGVVPYNGSNNAGFTNNSNIVPTRPHGFSGSGNKASAGYPNESGNPAGISNASASSGKAGYPPAPGNTKEGNGSGYSQTSAPTLPNNQQSVPENLSNSWEGNHAVAAPGPAGGSGGGYTQSPQPAGGPGVEQQQQQQPNWQGNNAQQGVPTSQGESVQGAPPANGQGAPYGNGSPQPNWQGPQGGPVTQGPPRGPMPKGDYVYYDGHGNQVQPGGGPVPNGSGRETHFHHHYYHNEQQPQQQQPQVGYPYDKKMEKKKRRSGAAKHVVAHAAALITCWACTCCCHVPCGF